MINERHLRTVLDRYAAHYNHRRPHRALQLAPPRPDSPAVEPSCTSIRRRPVLNGLINEYEPTCRLTAGQTVWPTIGTPQVIRPEDEPG
ncbi:integrase core domain-containing protein [Actinosynnema sp. NPDC091369]